MPTTYQPITSLRFKDLMVRIAEFLGNANYGDSGTGKATLPESEADLDIVKRVTNDGFRRFISEAVDPRTGSPHTWRFLNQYFELDLRATADNANNVDNDVGRYYMPWWFNGIAVRDWEFNSESYSHPIRIVSSAVVQKSLSVTQNTSGPPHYCVFRRLAARSGDASKEARLWEAVFWPKPSESLTINNEVRAYPNGMQKDDDFHFAGAEHDHAILMACKAQAEMERYDRMGVQNLHYASALANSIAIDLASAPRSLGFNIDQAQAGPRDRHFGYTGVDSYNGVPIAPAS